MIRARVLTRDFGRLRAVDAVDFHVPRGAVVGFLGPNGAGKTTTIRMISGYLPPTSGSVAVDGLDVREHWRAVRQRVGYLPESAPLYGEMRVEEYLLFRTRLFGIPRARRRAAIDLAVDRCWLGEVRRRPIGQLSKGFRQRVGLAAAMVHQPPVLVLDEPTVGLDPSQIRAMRGLIRELAESGGHTILLSTHILPEVEITCDRLIMIARGRIRAEGTIDELRVVAGRGGRYVIETDAPEAREALAAMPGVKRVETATTVKRPNVRTSKRPNGAIADSEVSDPRWRRLLLTPEDEAADLRQSLAELIRERRWAVRELGREQPGLEQFFITTAEHADEASLCAPSAGRSGADARGKGP